MCKYASTQTPAGSTSKVLCIPSQPSVDSTKLEDGCRMTYAACPYCFGSGVKFGQAQALLPRRYDLTCAPATRTLERLGSSSKNHVGRILLYAPRGCPRKWLQDCF